MSRAQKLDLPEITARLMAVRLIVRGMAGAMPTLAAEMRREACESIDDIIYDLGRAAR